MKARMPEVDSTDLRAAVIAPPVLSISLNMEGYLASALDDRVGTGFA